jgi:hypothetical protein
MKRPLVEFAWRTLPTVLNLNLLSNSVR